MHMSRNYVATMSAASLLTRVASESAGGCTPICLVCALIHSPAGAGSCYVASSDTVSGSTISRLKQSVSAAYGFNEALKRLMKFRFEFRR
jgi:hypothetical protein